MRDRRNADLRSEGSPEEKAPRAGVLTFARTTSDSATRTAWSSSRRVW
jgi:hypothetical protein